MWQKLKNLIDERLIRPMRDSHAPVGELALGTSFGVFWALTPLVGIQMLLTTATWVLFKGTRIRHNLPIALAWVWITNPVTMPIFYYTFYMVGFLVFWLVDSSTPIVSFELFQLTIEQADSMNLWDGVMHWVRFILNDLGWPMVVGSALTGIPIATAVFPLSKKLINRYRSRVAASRGLTLEEWEEVFVYHQSTMEDILTRKHGDNGGGSGSASGSEPESDGISSSPGNEENHGFAKGDLQRDRQSGSTLFESRAS